METGDDSVNISFWQYAHALHQPNVVASLNDRTRGALKMLYFRTSPYITKDLPELLHESDAVAVHGLPGLAGFAVALRGQLTNDFPELGKELAQLNGAKGKWYSLVICDFIRCKENGNDIIYYYLKSRFRAAMAQCFGDEKILSW